MIDETVEEIREMQTHSSSVVAIKAARALASLAAADFPTVEEYQRAIERNSSALRRANPSHASLQTTQREICDAVVDGEFEDVQAAEAALRDVVDEVADAVESAKRRAGENAASLFGDGDVVLTHDYSSTVLAAMDAALADGASFEVFVTEARPRYLGRKLARALGTREGVSAHLVVDGANGHFMADCDRVVIGMDCIVEDTLYNRVGTYPLCATAAHAGVPVYVVGSAAKVVDSGFVFENEHRSPSEVMREPPEGFSIENPAYDATPMELVEAVLTDEGRLEC